MTIRFALDPCPVPCQHDGRMDRNSRNGRCRKDGVICLFRNGTVSVGVNDGCCRGGGLFGFFCGLNFDDNVDRVFSPI